MTRPRSTDRRRWTARQIAMARAERIADEVLEALVRVAFSDIRVLFDQDGTVKQGEDLAAAAAACGASVEVSTQPAAGGEGSLRVVTIRLGDKVAALEALAQRFALLTDSAMNNSMFVQRSAPGRRTM